MFTRPPRGGQGLTGPAEAVVQHRCRVVRQTDRASLASRGRIPDAGRDEIGRLGLESAVGGEQQRRVHDGCAPGRPGDRVGLLDEIGRGAELTRVDVDDGAVRERRGQDVQRAGVTRQPDRAGGEVVPRVVVPQIGRERLRGDGAGEPQPAHVVVAVRLDRAAERCERSPERLDARCVPVREPRREAIQQQIDRTWGTGSGRRVAHGLDRVLHAIAIVEATREDRRSERLEIRLTGQRRVEWLEASGRGEQQLPGIPASCAREGDLRAEAFETRSLKVVEGPELGGREQRGCRVGRAGVELRLGCGEGTRSPATGIGRQLDRPGEERGGSRDPAARQRPVGGALELMRHDLVGARGGMRAVPRPAVGIGVRVGRIGQRSMGLASVRARRCPIRRGAHERVTKAHPGAEVDQIRGFGRRGCIGRDPEPVGCAPQQAHVPDRLGGGHQQEASRRRRKPAEPVHEALLDAAGQRLRVRKRESARQLRGRQIPRQLQQRKGVPAGLGDDPVVHPRVQPSGDRRLEERASVTVTESGHHELR